MDAKVLANGYMTGKVFIIWDIPHDKINRYEVWRDDVMIAEINLDEETVIPPIHEDLEKAEPFVHPCLFDHDHHTNLFWKESNHQLMYVDETVVRYQEYKYHVIACRINEKGERMEEIQTRPLYTQAQ